MKRNKGIKLLEPKKDCFGYDKNEKELCNRCTALNNLYCCYEVCNFYKTREEEALQRIKYSYIR